MLISTVCLFTFENLVVLSLSQETAIQDIRRDVHSDHVASLGGP